MLKLKPLKDRLLELLSHKGQVCQECCEFDCDKKCVEGAHGCKTLPEIHFDPIEGDFVCENGHHTEPKNFYNVLDLSQTLDAILHDLCEFNENEMVYNYPLKNLPLLIGKRIRFDSSRDIIEQRLRENDIETP